MKKRLAAILLCLCMAFTLLPATALAADGEIIYLGGVQLLGSADAPVYAMTQDGRAIPGGGDSRFPVCQGTGDYHLHYR